MYASDKGCGAFCCHFNNRINCKFTVLGNLTDIAVREMIAINFALLGIGYTQQETASDNVTQSSSARLY